MKRDMAKVIAITNQKGGVGKTTTAINLSAALAYNGRRTLLIDFDPQGMSTLGLGKPKASGKGVYQALTTDTDIMECIVGTDLDNFYLCPCSPELAGIEAEIFTEDKREYRLLNALDKAKKYFHFILIDCPPSLGVLTLNALTAADSLLIPVQTEFFCMEGIPDLFNLLETVRTYFNPKLSVEGLLLTMYDERTNLSKQVADEIRKSLDSVLFRTIIPRSIRLAESPSFGKPIVIYDIKSKGAEAYLHLAEEIIRK